MKSSVKTISQSKREIEVEVPKEEVEKELQRIVTQYSTKAKISGFRPGKAPKDLVKRMFLPEIKKSLIDSLVPRVLDEELKNHSLTPVDLPVIQDLHFEKEDEPLRFKASFQIWPEFKLPDYKRVKVKRRMATVTDEEVNQSLEELQKSSAEYVPVKGRGVVDGDYIAAELKGRNVKSKKYLPTERVVILAGHPDNEKKLNENIIGLKEGEHCTFILSYEREHRNKKLAGREIEYEIKVESIKEKNLPEINDDFAKTLGEYESLEDLRKKLKEQILASKEHAGKDEMAEKIVENIAEKVSVELPESLLERESLSILKRCIGEIPRQEITKEKVEALKSEAKKQAEKNLRNHMILTKIAEVEGFEVSEEDEEQEMKAIAKANNIPLARVVDSINTQGKREELRGSVLMKKTVDFLVKQAIIE